MKVWFFSEKWKSSRGWKNAYREPQNLDIVENLQNNDHVIDITEQKTSSSRRAYCQRFFYVILINSRG